MGKLRSRRLRAFLALWLIHYVLTWGALLYSITHLHEIEAGEPPSFSLQVSRTLYTTLSAPLSFFLLATRSAKWFPGLWGHVPVLLNSALWSGLILWLWSRRAGAASAR